MGLRRLGAPRSRSRRWARRRRLAGLYAPVAGRGGPAAVRRAFDRGIRYFDTAPHYGAGRGERRARRRPARRLRDLHEGRAAARALRPGEPPNRPGSPTRRRTGATGTGARDGVLRSLESPWNASAATAWTSSTCTTPTATRSEVYASAYPALAALRDEGVVRAIGAGMNQSAMLTRFVERLDLDVVLCAGRYTLLDRPALEDLLPPASAVAPRWWSAGCTTRPARGRRRRSTTGRRRRSTGARGTAGGDLRGPRGAVARRRAAVPAAASGRGLRRGRLPVRRRGGRQRRPARPATSPTRSGTTCDASTHTTTCGTRPPRVRLDGRAVGGPDPRPFRRRRYARGRGAPLVRAGGPCDDRRRPRLLASAAAPVAGVVGWTDLTAPDVADAWPRCGRPGRSSASATRCRTSPTRVAARAPVRARHHRRRRRRAGLRPAGPAAAGRSGPRRRTPLPEVSLRPRPRRQAGHRRRRVGAVGDVDHPLAALPNVTVKLSGLVTEAAGGLEPAESCRTRGTCCRLGPGRAMYGSDWPVCTLAATPAR